jgi:hypothetical protein
MKKSTKEWLTGILIGIILMLLLTVKVVAAPLSEEDQELLTRTVYLEAGNQDLKGKRLVVSVILNRVDSEEFPDTVEEVLGQDGQFQTYKHLEDAEPTWTDKLAVKMETEGRLNTGVYFFRTGHYGCGDPLFQYGDHYFSTLK